MQIIRLPDNMSWIIPVQTKKLSDLTDLDDLHADRGLSHVSYLVQLLRRRLRRLPGGELHEGEVLAGDYSDGAKLPEAVERVAKILKRSEATTWVTSVTKKRLRYHKRWARGACMLSLIHI